MGLFKKRADPAEIERLRAEIEQMQTHLAASDAAKQQLGDQVAGLVTRLDTPVGPPPSEPPPPAAPAFDRAELDMLNARLERVTHRLDEVPDGPPVDPAELTQIRSILDGLAQRIEQVDARITSISTELANQISELSGDIETLGGGDDAPADEIVGELRDAQTRLANEQARYQIAFRQDLADLADRLRRS